MTGAPLPEAADSVVKYEIVGVVEGDGKPGSLVSFAEPTKLGSNVRAAGEEARAGEVIVRDGEVVNAAGVGFLAGCGITERAGVPSPAHRRHLHRLGADAPHPGAHPRQDSQLQQLRPSRRGAPGGGYSHYSAHRGGFPGGAGGRDPAGRARLRLRAHQRRRLQRRFRLHQAGGGAARRAAYDHGEHAPGQGADVRPGERRAGLRLARQPRSGLRGLPDARAPGAAQDAGLQPLRPSAWCAAA